MRRVRSVYIGDYVSFHAYKNLVQCFIQTTCCISKLVRRLNSCRLSTSSYRSWNFSSKALTTIARLVLKVGVRNPFSTENNSLCKCIAFTCRGKTRNQTSKAFARTRLSSHKSLDTKYTVTKIDQLGTSYMKTIFLEIITGMGIERETLATK